METPILARLKTLFGNNLLGPNELKPFFEKFDKNYFFEEIPQLHYSWEELEKYSKDYILVMGVPEISLMRKPITIATLRDKFGFNPDVSEPCFYNQDWYMHEEFINKSLPLGWYLIKKDVIEKSRAQQPLEIMSGGVTLPSAILCAYTFFAYYFCYNYMLWYHDFIWCSDVDHNGDRIYVGKYNDVDGVNKNGFSVHRHLALRDFYGAVGVI